MKMFKRGTLVSLTGAAACIMLIVLLVQVLSPKAEASYTDYPIRILEITDPNSGTLTGGTELGALKGISNITVDTVTMKKFVSLREDWDGKYDAIYIGRGTFSPKLVASNSDMNSTDRDKAHNTLAVQNDITNLKAKEIIDYYINKGLYVFLAEETFDTQQAKASLQGKLYASFNVYRTTSVKPNVIFLNDTKRSEWITGIKNRTPSYVAGLTRRPLLTISNKSDIRSYLTNARDTYNPGDALTFRIRLNNVPNISTSPVRIRLYMNVDSSIPMTEAHVVSSLEMNSNEGTLQYTLPETYSGPLYWKLEASDTATGLKNFDSDAILFKGIRPVIKVLQVMPAGRTSSNLTVSDNMDQSYLTQQYLAANNLSSADYKLEISTMDMRAFNAYIASRISTTDPTGGLNGVYDMVVFGFQDMYDRVSTPMISEQAARAVKAFALQTKQSLMLTHDTIFRNPQSPYAESTNSDGSVNYNYWSYYFHRATATEPSIVGQALPRTYLGGQAVNTAVSVVPINSGLLTQYPFNLSSVPLKANNSRYQVAQTHDQFFPLDLERADVIPWYNIKSDSGKIQRDTDDSYNHFYTYSVGSITFSGTGHSSTRFPDWEQKLFVNTMYRAFVGANHAPEITVKAPAEGSIIPSYTKEILVDYSAKDFDLNDRDLTSSIRFKSGNSYISGAGVEGLRLQSGQTISRSFANPLPSGGNLQIEIKVWDSHGALATRLINVTIKPATASLTATRSLPADVVNGQVIRGRNTAITYTVTPNPIPFSQANITAEAGDRQIISNIVFKESFPPDLEITGSSTDITKSGTAASGYSVTKKLNDIRYTLQTGAGGVKTFVPDAGQEVSFSITVSPQKSGSYLVDSASLQYDEIHAVTEGSLLGAGKDYSLVVVGLPTGSQPVTINNLSIQGRVAASGDVDFRNIMGGATIGDVNKMPQDALVAGGSLYYNNNITINGNAVYGGSYYYSGAANTQSIKGSVIKGSPIDFASLRERMTGLSAKLAALAVNGTVNWKDRKITLTGNDGAKLYVFSVTADMVNNAQSINVSVPQGSTVVVNIGAGSSYVTMALDTNLGSIDAGHILYNFPSATKVDLKYTLKGTFLAPLASVGFDNGQLNGQVIAGAVSRMTTLAYAPFTGSVPLNEDPVPGSVFFSPLQLALHAVVKVERITLPNTNILLNDQPWPIEATIEPDDATNKALTWRSADPDTVYIDPVSGMVTGKKVTSAPVEITATATDGSGVTGKALITVKDRKLRIEGGDAVKPKTDLALSAIYETILENNITYTWKVLDKDGREVNSYIKTNADKAIFNAPASGVYTVQVSVSSDKVTGILATKTVTVSNPLQSLLISGSGNTLPIQQSMNLTAQLTPADAEGTDLEWSFVNAGDSQYAGLSPGTGSNQCTLVAKNAQNQTVAVIVRDKTTGITSPPYQVSITGLNGLEFSKFRHSMFVGDSFDLMSLLWTSPRTIALNTIQNNLTWSSSTTDIASFTNSRSSIITGNRKGTTTVTVSYSVTGLPDPITATIIVNVENRPSTRDGDRY